MKGDVTIICDNSENTYIITNSSNVKITPPDDSESDSADSYDHHSAELENSGDYSENYSEGNAQQLTAPFLPHIETDVEVDPKTKIHSDEVDVNCCHGSICNASTLLKSSTIISMLLLAYLVYIIS